MSVLSIILILIISFVAGMGSINDHFETHQPIIACTLIGIALGQPTQGIILGGTLQLIALGWMNIGAAAAPDTLYMSIVTTILVCGPAGLQVQNAVALAIPIAMAGLIATTICRTLATFIVRAADSAVEKNNIGAVKFFSFAPLFLHGLRAILMAVVTIILPAEQISSVFNAIPQIVQTGLTVGAGCIVVVGYAMIMNMIINKELWPFFFLGFALSALSELNLISMGVIGIVIALLYISVTRNIDTSVGVFDMDASAIGSGVSASGTSADVLDQLLED